MFKKILSLGLACVMALTMGTVTLAAPAERGTTILVNDSQNRIVESFSGGQRFVATYNKVDNTLSLVCYNANEEMLQSSTVDLNNDTVLVRNEYGVLMAANSISKYTDSLYAYIKTYGSPNKWELRRPEYLNESSDAVFYFKTNETTVNKSDLSGFRTTVNSMATLEGKLESAVGTTSALAVIAGASAGVGGPVGWGAAAAALLAALGFANTVQNYGYDIEEKQIEAWDYYYEVYYNSSVYF